MADFAEMDITRTGAPVAVAASPWVTEARELVKLALPLVVTQLAQMAIMTTDVIMLGRLGETALAGAALGNTVFFLTWLFGFGTTAAVSPMIAHILGANPNNRAGVRAVVRMGLWSVLLLSLPLAILLLFTEELLLAFAQQPALAEAAGRFVTPLCVGLPFSLGYQVLRNYATALGKPKAALWVMIVTIAFNAVADYALIFGHFGMPRLELFGSGVATACSFTFCFLAMVAVVYLTPALRKYRILRRIQRPDWPKFAELFRLGMPIGLTTIFEVMLFNTATLLMGTFGTATLAAHQVAINIASVTFMVPLGVAMAATVRVGLAAGAGDRAGVRRAGYMAFAVSTSFMCVAAVILVLFRYQIAGLYFAADSAANADVLALAALFLQVAAAFQVMDGLQVTAALSLRGLKDARTPMWIAGGSYWLAGFPLCLWLGVGLGMKGLGVWIGLAFALMIAAIFLCWRFQYLSRERTGG